MARRWLVLALAFTSVCTIARADDPAGPPPLTNTEASQMAPDALSRRAADYIALLLTQPPTAAFPERAQKYYGNALAYLLALEPGTPVPADVTTPDMRDRLARLLIPEAPANSGAPLKRLRTLFLRTRFYATTVAGLCATQSVGLQFQRVGTVRGADATVMPAEFFISTSYLALSPPTSAAPVAISLAAQLKLDRVCAALPLKGRETFHGYRGEAEAARGYWVATALGTALAGSHPSFPLPCEGAPDCLKELRDLPHRLQVASCAVGETSCRLYVGGGLRQVDITLGPGTKPRILGVSSQIILAVSTVYDPDDD